MIFETISNEAHSENDNEMCNHLKEIFVLCKLCLWNSGKFYLEFTPWGVIYWIVILDAFLINLKYQLSTNDCLSYYEHLNGGAFVTF